MRRVRPLANEVSDSWLSFGALWPTPRRGCGVVLTKLRNSPVAQLLLGKLARAAENFMNRLLIGAILTICVVPLYARAQQPDAAKLKADAQKIASIIRADKGKTQAYCQINSLGGEIDLAAQAKDEQKADALTKKINDLEKQLGPEYRALFDALNDADPNSKDVQDILSMFDSLDESCPH
jgi:hypothetical protein